MVGGISALGAGLFSIGIPKNSVMQYETEVKNGKLLLVVHGTADEVERAKDILDQTASADNNGPWRTGRRWRVMQLGPNPSSLETKRPNFRRSYDVHQHSAGDTESIRPSPIRRKSFRLSSTGIPRCSTGGRSGWWGTSWRC